MPVLVYDHSQTAMGEFGSDVGAMAIRRLPALLRKKGLFVMLTYAYGDASGPVALQKELSELYGQSHFGFRITPLPQKYKMWRVLGEKSLSNPMRVQYMIAKYLDPDYSKMRARDGSPGPEKQAGIELASYVDWVEKNVAAKGYTHLHYVTIEIWRKDG